MQSKYSYTATIEYMGMKSEVRARSIRQLSILLNLSHPTVRDLVYGGTNRKSKWSDRIKITRQLKPRRRTAITV